MLNLFASVVLAYLLGSIPTGFIFAKLLKGVDIRRHGSGNVGATNVFRIVGKIPAIIVFALDIIKGVVAVGILPKIFFNNTIGITLGLEPYRIYLGIFAICGHIWSVFLKFKGGKGVATTAGALAALAPQVLAGSAFVWIIVFARFRIVSAASIIASVFLPIFAIVFNRSIHVVIFCALLSAIGTYRHNANIRRLLRGEEKKLF